MKKFYNLGVWLLCFNLRCSCCHVAVCVPSLWAESLPYGAEGWCMIVAYSFFGCLNFI